MLRQLSTDPAVGEVTIMAHSMGSWLTVEALRQMAIRDGRVAPKIQKTSFWPRRISMSTCSAGSLPSWSQAPHFTLFVSQDDRALSLSRRISGNIDRLGQVDPTVEPYRSEFEKAGSLCWT